jgi:serine/threonine-protein kinase
MEDAAPVLVPGYRLDRYELLTPIASGGMASVWLARLRGKRGFEKLFAIKTIRTELTGDSRFQEMFLDEARIASAIQHPNVAQILDLGEQDDILYIVMEWVDGDSLAKIRRLAQRQGTPLPLGLALRILADACAGLHAAHELCDREGKRLDVVHRDVSPHNILVSRTGSVKVIDFGVAKALGRQAGETRTGVVKGKIRYMAPEQAQGRPLDRRADVWAVGICLYELVTGDLPFDGDSDVDILRRLMGDEPAPRASGAVPGPIEDLLERSLVRDPEARFPTAAAMARALQTAIEELGLPSTNEDVADFLRANLLELETKRGDAVAKALASSQSREAQTPTPPDDPALAATVVSHPEPERRASSEAETVAAPKHPGPTAKPARPKKRARAPKPARPDDESKLTPPPSALPEEKPAPPRRGLWWGLGLAVVAGGGWLVWSGGPTLRDRVPEPPPQAAPASPSPAPAAPPSVGPTSLRPASTATAAVTATPSATATASAAAVPSATATASDALPDAGKRIRKRRPAPPEGSSEPAEPEENSPYD